MAVARGAATPGHPELWLIAEQRLYISSTAPRHAQPSPETPTMPSKPPSGIDRMCSGRWSATSATSRRRWR
jgi:hypothetical protein